MNYMEKIIKSFIMAIITVYIGKFIYVGLGTAAAVMASMIIVCIFIYTYRVEYQYTILNLGMYYLLIFLTQELEIYNYDMPIIATVLMYFVSQSVAYLLYGLMQMISSKIFAETNTEISAEKKKRKNDSKKSKLNGLNILLKFIIINITISYVFIFGKFNHFCCLHFPEGTTKILEIVNNYVPSDILKMGIDLILNLLIVYAEIDFAMKGNILKNKISKNIKIWIVPYFIIKFILESIITPEMEVMKIMILEIVCVLFAEYKIYLNEQKTKELKNK